VRRVTRKRMTRKNALRLRGRVGLVPPKAQVVFPSAGVRVDLIVSEAIVDPGTRDLRG